ncbi:MAG: radical SAM protein [Candidatus Omnitrophota bacterium]
MISSNPVSKRKNPFRDIYDAEEFRDISRLRSSAREFPYLVDVELTNHCNLKCVFCAQMAMKREKGFMSEETFRKVADECSLYKAPLRFIRWGEPFLHPKVMDFCGYAKSKGLAVHVTNNGLAIREQHMRALVEFEVDSIIFSMQGATKEEYEKMRDAPRYDELKGNIETLIKIRGGKEKPFIHISSTMTNETRSEIDAFAAYWGNIVDSVGVGKTSFSRLSESQVSSLERIKKYEAYKKQETIKKCYRPCSEVYQRLSVDWDGKVTCCNGDFDNFMTVGDMKGSTLFDIWNNSAKLKAFRDLLDKNRREGLALCGTCYHAYEEF